MPGSRERKTNYITTLTHRDRVAVSFQTKRGHVSHFSLQYEILLEGRWRKVVRFDSSHGVPHKHTFRRNGEAYRHDIPFSDIKEALTTLLLHIKDNYESMRENYLST